MKLRLPETVYTVQDVQALLLDVKTYTQWFNHQAIKKKLKIKRASNSQPSISIAAQQLIHDWSIQKPISQSSLDELIAAIESFQVQAPQFNVTLAAPPTAKIKQSIVNWCRDNVTTNALVNFQFDANILGGVVIRYGSQLFDWSFRRQILASRHNFPEILRRV
jgi:F0F1-type ATP synthase delta subunit